LLEFFVFLPFISGPAAMHVIAEKRKWAFTVCDKLISGALLGNFMLVAPSILIGFFSNYLNKLFELYTLLSLSALVPFLFCVLKGKKWRLPHNIKPTGFGLKVYVLPILLFALLVLFLHTLYLEYDPIFAFFPYAKSVALTGSMKYNVYDQTTLSTGMPPVLPVIYAWAFTTINDLNAMGIYNDMHLHDMLRPIPAAYFLLTALVVYLIARETLQKKYAFLSVIIFVSFPSTILTLSAFTYYLELGFVFYLVSAVLCLTKSLKTRKSLWFFLTGVSASLLLLAKELSVFIVPLIFSMFVLFSSIRYRRGIFVTVSTLPFYLIFIWDMYASPTSAVGWILLRQLPVFALSIALYCLSKTVKKFDHLVTWKNLVQFLIPFIPSGIFALRGIVSLGSLYSMWGPAFSDPTYVHVRAVTGTTQEAIEVTNFFRWDIPFLSLGLGVSFLIPILFSVVYLFKRRHQGCKLVNLLVLMMLLTLIETMSFTLVGSQAESRRLYYFAPILAIFAANGLMLLGNFLKNKYFLYLCILFNSIAISYIWLFRFPFQTLLGLSYLKKSVGLASALDLVFLSLIFMGVFFVFPLAQKRIRIGNPENSKARLHIRKKAPALPLNLKNPSLNDNADKARTRAVPISLVNHKKLRAQSFNKMKIGSHGRRRIIYLPLLTLSCFMVLYPTIPIWLEGANRDFDFLSFQYDVYEPTWENGILTISYYYTERINDDHVTVSFGGRALRYFANRSMIDLTTVMGVHSLRNILAINASGELLQALKLVQIYRAGSTLLIDARISLLQPC